MLIVKILFWFLLFIVFYAYIGYGIVLYVLVKLKRITAGTKPAVPDAANEPEVTLFIAAYNKKDFVAEKIKNSRELDYPAEKLHMVWVTDGSDDGTPNELKKYEGVTVHHLPQRNGKIGADTPLRLAS